jgi:autotransporter-associated beta strand protein
LTAIAAFSAGVTYTLMGVVSRRSFLFFGGIVSSKAITLNSAGGTFLADVGTASTLNGAIAGTGSWTKTAPGTLILTGANTYASGTTISAGTLQLGNGGSSGSITGNVTDNGVLAFNRTKRWSAPLDWSVDTVLSLETSLIAASSALATLRGRWPSVGNYTQNAGGTLRIEIAGVAPSQHDILAVNGIGVNVGEIGLYSTIFGNGLYLDTAVNGGPTGYNIQRTALQGTAKWKYRGVGF